MKMSPWIEAMRLRTLPVSCAGVVAAIAMSVLHECFLWLPAMLCLAFAVLAQIASNFANEYYDYRDGLDRRGREGPRRGVTEGDISPKAMIVATFATLGIACAIGCSLIIWGGWILIPAGAVIALGALAYSAGPYPLSRHGLGEVAVVIFFGIIPVNFTYFIMAGSFSLSVAIVSIAIGLMGANILVVNNYRDIDDDRDVGKHTLASIFGHRFASGLYLANGLVAMMLVAPILLTMPLWCFAPVIVYMIIHISLWLRIRRSSGRALNPMLGMTAMNMLLFSLLLTLEFAIIV